MRILGIDPGSRVTGFGVIEADARRAVYVASGCIRADGADFPARLRVIFDGVQAVIAEYCPDVAAIENVFVQRNASSALKLGQARGAAICALVLRELTVHEYTPAEIKQSITGRGGAGKEQIQHMVSALLALPSAPRADAADALACALTHHHAASTLARIHAGARTPARSALA